MIQIKSISGGEKEISEYILSLLTSCGFKPLEFKGNIVLQIKGVNSSRCLIFNSHIDTVAEGDISKWNTDPFSGSIIGKKVFGLGASDNKSSVAVLIELAKTYSLKVPECDILLTFTVGEEVDGHGTNDTVKWLATKYLKEYKSIAAIVCEPTGLTKIGLAHKGNIFLKVTTKGVSGHGSKPIQDSEHAVLKMYAIMAKMQELGKKWAKKYINEILGSSTMALATSIQAGDISIPNKYPDKCEATFDIRTIPEMHSSAFSQIKKTIGKLGMVEFLYPPVGCGFTDKGTKIAQVLKKVSKSEYMAFPGSTDMPFFTEKGIPTVIFGPGEISQMHKPNEFCYLDKVQKCTAIFKEVIKQYNNEND